MDKKKFLEKMETADDFIDMEYIRGVLGRAIDANPNKANPRGHNNLIIVMEELAELSQAVAKKLRGKGDYNSILEELADVQLAIFYVQEICGIQDDELNRAINVKVDRVKETVESKGYFQ